MQVRHLMDIRHQEKKGIQILIKGNSRSAELSFWKAGKVSDLGLAGSRELQIKGAGLP